MIEFGSTEYFTLLGIQQKLKAREWYTLGLTTIYKFQSEVDQMIEAIHFRENHRRASLTNTPSK